MRPQLSLSSCIITKVFVNCDANVPNNPYLDPDYSVRSFEEEDTGSTCDSTCQKLVGIAFVLIGEFFHGCQFVYEEKYVIAYDLHPLKVVGYEGVKYKIVN